MARFIPEDDGGKIKPANYKHDYTPREMMELVTCEDDIHYFLKNYAYIIHPTKGAMKFNTYDFQRRLLDNYIAYDRVICMLPRQTGKTTTSCAYLFWKACFFSKQTILIAANIGSTAKEIMERIREMYMECPWFLKPGLVVNNVHEMKFDNGSRIIAETTTKNTGRGKSISVLYLDEFAYVNPGIQKEFWTSILPTISTGGQMIITSTPNNDEDKFANIWFGAEDANNSFEWKDDILEVLGIDGKRLAQKDYETVYETDKIKTEFEFMEALQRGDLNKDENEIGFKRFFVHWAEHPDRDESFKLKILSEGTDLSEWQREYECLPGDTCIEVQDSHGRNIMMTIKELYDELGRM